MAIFDAIRVLVAMAKNGRPGAANTMGWYLGSRYKTVYLQVRCGVGRVVQGQRGGGAAGFARTRSETTAGRSEKTHFHNLLYYTVFVENKVYK